MSRFNSKPERVTNYMEAPAFKYDTKMELVTIVLTSFVQDKYYESAKDEIKRVKELVNKDPIFAAKLAVYARNEFGMRSITHVIAGEVAKIVKKEHWTRKFFNKVVRRVDDTTEILAYYLGIYGKPIPNSLKRGLADSFSKFDRYQLAKYRSAKKDVSLVDVVKLVHPVPTQSNGSALKDLVDGKLRSVDTWEAKLTDAGKKGTTKKEVDSLKKDAWADLIKSKKLGYFALLRNLRNILEQAPEVINEACDMLTNKRLISKSLVLPFRYLSAYNELLKLNSDFKFESDTYNVDKVISAIDTAIKLSVDNLPTLYGKTVILSDNSGSMRGDGGGHSLVSAMSSTTTADIANLFSVLYWLKADDTLIGLFGDELVLPKLDRNASMFNNFKKIDDYARTVGGATETGIYTMFDKMIEDKIHVDTMVVFSDCQIGTGNYWFTTRSYKGGRQSHGDFNKLYERYVREVNPNIRVYSIDLKGYGTTVFNKNVIRLAGWSEKIFDIMKYMEQDKKALIRVIESIEF